MAKLTEKPRTPALVRAVGTVLTAGALLAGCDSEVTGVVDVDPIDGGPADVSPADAGHDSMFVGVRPDAGTLGDAGVTDAPSMEEDASEDTGFVGI